MIIKNGTVYQDGIFITKDIHIQQDKIVSSTTETNIIIDATGLYVIPGLTDIHLHGCVGYDFCDGTTEAISAMAKYEGKNGITSFAPATMTLDDERLTDIFTTASTYDNPEGTMLMGINMEGPYLSMAKKGAQNGAFLKTPTVEHFRKMNALSNGLIKLVSIAPEEPNSMEFIKTVKDEVILSIAHTSADYDIAMKAFACGASHVTHLYNAMLPFTHRSPGVIGAAADTENCFVELICDGVHIHPSVVRSTFKLFDDNHIVLISDSMMATGLDDGEYSLGGQKVYVKGNVATLADGTIAGSATNLMECMKKAVSFGIPLESAIKCAAVNPAKEIGIYDQVGSISVGKYANLVLLDKELSIHSVYIKGKLQ